MGLEHCMATLLDAHHVKVPCDDGNYCMDTLDLVCFWKMIQAYLNEHA